MDGKLEICFIVNQDNLIMGEGCKGKVIFGLDVWEYVYYLYYQNCCLDYINVFFNVINWDEVVKCYVVVK